MSNIIDLRQINGLDDEELSKKIKVDLLQNKNIEIVLQYRTVLVFVNSIFVYKGNFSDKCLKTIKDKNNVSLFKVKSPTNTIEDNIKDIKDISVFPINDIDIWVKKIKGRLSTPKKIEQEVWSNAKEHCQKCGENVACHPITKEVGNFGQIAHIEACGFGERYNSELENPNEIENLMLLCYACHRIIDVVNPEKYTVEILKDLKIKHEAKVKLLLSTLKNTEAIPLRISTRLYGDDHVYATDNQIVEALNKKQLSISSNFLCKTLLTNPFEEKRVPHSAKYWDQFFGIYQKDSAFINDQKNNSSELALFLYHGISDMIFLGSRFGDTMRVHLFQKHRNENDHFNWTWPNENDMSGNGELSFSSNEIKAHNQESEGLLLVTLSADIKTEELPAHLYNNGYVLPTIKIESNQKRNTVISKEVDLQEVKTLLNNAMKKMKDIWKLKKIHIVVIAPTVINFSIGCSIQSKYQGEIICYERNSKTETQEPTICIKEDIAYYVPDETVHFKLK